MSGLVWIPLSMVAAGVALAGGVLAARQRARRRPVAREQRLAAARRAARDLRRSGPRPHRDTFERGRPPGDRYSGAILENATYGDAAHLGGFDGGSGADGGGGFDSGGGGSY